MKFTTYYAPESDSGASAGGDTGGMAASGNPFEGGAPEVTTTQPATTAPDVTTQTQTPVTQTQTPVVPATTTTPTSQPQQPAALSPERIAEIAAQAAVRVGQQPTQQQATQQQPQMTQEEFNQRFNVVNLTANDFTAITGYAPDKPEQVQALNAFAQNIVKQSLTMVQTHVASVTQQIRNELTQQFEGRFGEVSPLLQQYQSQVGDQIKGEFFQQNPDLQELEPLVTEVANQLKASGQKMSKAEAFKFVADKTRSLVPSRALGTTQSMGATASTTQQGQQPVQRQMTTTSVGGQVGSTNGSATQPRSDAKSIFG